ncbi:MAG TPA: tRNA (adenosine(37)-N6)-threonylcarbamoyltransferase complex ATPase subunit type 1 TsaE, partial [Acidimicrobiaceae bacterium]|nr:tRNA (adenosine(37)-N6)-threonylcarbamoyltransferase complex ATPase subunit type 1 TsaE [Acidimicrobiaceae bacterium]
MISCATTDVAGTQALAAEVAALVVDGDLLVLVGDLGAGKTHFTKGFA